MLTIETPRNRADAIGSALQDVATIAGGAIATRALPEGLERFQYTALPGAYYDYEGLARTLFDIGVLCPFHDTYEVAPATCNKTEQEAK